MRESTALNSILMPCEVPYLLFSVDVPYLHVENKYRYMYICNAHVALKVSIVDQSEAMCFVYRLNIHVHIKWHFITLITA